MGALFAQEGTDLMGQVTHITGIADTPLTMSSLEIHELTGKRHDHVMRDIRKMLGQLDVAAPQIWGTAFIAGPNGSRREIEIANLPRDLTETLITGYSTPLRHAVVVRLRELEAIQARPVNLGDAAALRGLLLGYTEQVLKLESKITEDKPKVEYFEDVRDATNTQTIGEFAKVLKFGQKKLFKWLRESEILMADNSPYQKHLDAGHFRVLDKATTKADGKKITYTQTVLTGKGKQYIQKRLKKAGNPDLSE
jgi:phage antirepressor YoqD-like protein